MPLSDSPLDGPGHPGDAAPLTLDTRAVSPAGMALIAEVCTRVCQAVAARPGYRRGNRRAATLRLAVEALVAGVLLNAARNGQREWSYQRLSSAAFTGAAVGKRQFDTAREALEAGGLIERLPAFTRFHGAPGGPAMAERKATRFRPTPALYALCAAHGVTIPPCPVPGWAVDFHRQRPAGPHKPLRLRALSTMVRGKRIEGATLDARDELWSPRFEREVVEFNAFIAKFDITGCDPIVFHRVFTHDYEHGGRWFASYSSMKAANRRHIQINGAAVAEVDVRASHLTILHGLAGRNVSTTVRQPVFEIRLGLRAFGLAD